MTAKDIALSELHTLKEIIKDVKDIELKSLMKEIRVYLKIGNMTNSEGFFA